MEQPQTSPALNRPLDHYVKMPPSREELQEANEDSDLCPALSFKIGTHFTFAGITWITWDCQPSSSQFPSFSSGFSIGSGFSSDIWRKCIPRLGRQLVQGLDSVGNVGKLQVCATGRGRGAAAVGWLIPNTNISPKRWELDG